MKTSFKRSLAAAILIALAALACNRGENAADGSAANATIAPAKPQPDSTGTADLTQTVDIEDSRSEAEGGVLTRSPQSTDTVNTATAATNTAGTTTTTTTTAPATATR